jgi:putative tricarboxylic transport membrane protein
MVYAIIVSNLLQSAVLLVVGLVFIYLASSVVRLRTRYIVPVVLILAIMGTYSIDGTISGPITLFVFAIIGVFMVRYHYPVSATVVGILLGRTLETEGIRSFQMSGGRASFLLHQPIAMGIFLLMVATVGRMVWSQRRKTTIVERTMSIAET